MFRSFFGPDRGRQWLGNLDQLRIDCAAACPQDQEHCLREFVRLLSAAPEPAAVRGVMAPAALQLAARIATGAYDRAVTTMLSRDCRSRVSRSGEGHYLASVALPGEADEHTAVGDTPALALIGATALALCEREARRRALGA